MKTRKEQMTGGGLDGYSNFIGDDSEYCEWYGCGGKSRDSDCLELSNFDCIIAQLEEADPDGKDHRTESYGHWAVGWIEEIYVRPKSKCFDIASEIERALENYPVLDEEDYSRREQEEAEEIWRNCYSDSDRIEYIRKNRSQFDPETFSDLLRCARGEFFLGYASELIQS